MGKHTPGPWMFTPWRGCFVILSQGDAGYEVGIASNNNKDPQNEANARLIVAAPDLLEACKLARHICEEGNALQQLIDAAIAKAEGA